jgi:hypothetical protein
MQVQVLPFALSPALSSRKRKLLIRVCGQVQYLIEPYMKEINALMQGLDTLGYRKSKISRYFNIWRYCYRKYLQKNYAKFIKIGRK